MVRDTPRPLGEHLEELRWRLLTCVLALMVGAGVSFAFFGTIADILLAPAEEHLSATGDPIFTEVTELFTVTVKVSLLGGLVLAVPVVTYQILMFITPGLTFRERRWALALVPGALVCFVGGAAFAYFVMLPPILRFLLTFGDGIADPMIRIGNYMSLMMTLLFWMGMVFQTPLIMLVLAKTGVVSPSALARGRRFAVVLAFILGAIITPTFDPVDQAAWGLACRSSCCTSWGSGSPSWCAGRPAGRSGGAHGPRVAASDARERRGVGAGGGGDGGSGLRARCRSRPCVGGRPCGASSSPRCPVGGRGRRGPGPGPGRAACPCRRGGAG